MRTCRVTLGWLLVLAAVVLSVPAAALATGPSAGDNQYTDPLATHHHTHTTTTSSTPTPTPPSTGSSGTPTTGSTGTTTAPTATTASTTTTATSNPASGKTSKSTLPRTGFPAALAAAIGLSLIGIGLVTRRRILWSGR